MSAPETSFASPEGAAYVRRLGVNTLAQTAGLVGGTILGFASFVAVTRGLGPQAFGDLTAATVFLLFPIALADVGLATGVLREMSAAPERADYVLRASVPLRFLISVGVLLLALAASLALPFADRAQTAIWIGSIGSFFTLLTLSLQPLFQARLRMHVPVGATLVGRTLTLVLILAAFAAERGFTAVVLAYVVGAAATFVIVLAVAARQVSLRPLIVPDQWAKLLRGSLAIGIATGLFLSYYRIDTVLVALFRDSREVGLYGAAFRFVEFAELLVSAIGVSIFPGFARLIATGDARIGEALQRTFDAVLAVAAPILLALLLVAEELISATAGEEFAEADAALRLLVPYLALLFFTGALIRIVAALHVDRYVLGVAVAVLVLNVALNIALLPRYGYKVAALTSTASEVCVAIALAAVTWRRLAFVPRLNYVWIVGLGAAVMVASYWLLPLPPLVAVALASLAYAAIVVLLPGTARDVVTALVRRA